MEMTSGYGPDVITAAVGSEPTYQMGRGSGFYRSNCMYWITSVHLQRLLTEPT